MNPNENNPISPAGTGGVAAGATPFPSTTPAVSGSDSATLVTSAAAATGGASSIAAPVDFTNLGGNSGSLSMSDSLASAQDNLTSAGQAANVGSHTPAIDQLGADKPAAEMDSPNQPLTPSAPLPGSIGSVSSGAPVGSSTSSAMPTMGGASTTPASDASAPAQPYYNPFASATAPTSASTTPVPPSLQPQANTFKNVAPAGGKGKSSMMSLLAWIIAVILAGTTVLFAILWQMAENKAPQEKIVYIEKPVEGVGKGAVSCVMNLGGEGVEGLDHLINRSRTMKADYADGELESISLMTGYDFVDNDAAEASRAFFDNENAYYANVAMGLAIQPVVTNLQIDGARADYTVTASADQLAGDYVNTFLLNLDAEGAPDTSVEGLRQAYESAGYICAAV